MHLSKNALAKVIVLLIVLVRGNYRMKLSETG